MSQARLSLSVELGEREQSVLRGTTLDILLRCFGHELRISPDKVAKDADLAESNYQKSHVVSALDTFLSHSWHAPWFKKWFTLLVYFNCNPALILGLTTCILVRLLGHYSGNYSGAAMVGMFVICIHQSNSTLKAVGISSIAGILSRSHKLLVAWDASYFKRLWCPFEIAAFTKAGPERHVSVLPVEMGHVLLYLSLAGFAKAVAFEAIVTNLHEALKGTGPLAALQFLSSVPIYTLVAISELQYSNSLSALYSQVSAYSIRDADCFCCNNDHVHPETGAHMSCDRQLVYNSISHWYGSAQRSQSQALDQFDAHVHRLGHETISQNLGACGVPYNFILLGTIWRAQAIIIGHGAYDFIAFWTSALHIIDTFFLREPMVFALVFVTSVHFNSCHRCFKIVLLSIFGSVVHFLCHEIAVVLEKNTFDPESKDLTHWRGLLLWMLLELVIVYRLYHPAQAMPENQVVEMPSIQR